MEQSNLIELIRTLNLKEKEQIKQFASINYFNNGKMKARVVSLLEICFDQDWESLGNEMDKRELFFKLFSRESSKGKKLEKVMVEAHKIVRAYLLTQHYFMPENDFQQNLDFAEIVRMRGLHSRQKQILSKIQRTRGELKSRDAHYFLQQFQLEKAILDFQAIRNHIKGDLNIPNVVYALELHYYLNKFLFLNLFLLQQKVANVFEGEMLTMLLKEESVPHMYLKESTILMINYEIYKLLKAPQPLPKDVRALFELLQIHEIELDSSSLRDFYTYLRNLCVLVSNKFIDNEEIRHTLFDLYSDNLKRGYLHYKGKLHPNTYLAVSYSAIRVNQFEWAKQFIEDHKGDVLEENSSQDIYRFNKALYLFGIGQFVDCLDNIPASSPFVDYLLHSKRLELKAYYELLPYKLDAFKMFLSRTSQKLLSESQRQIHTDFANLLHQLIASKPGDPTRSDRLVARIREKKQSAEWRWLLEKAQALKTT